MVPPTSATVISKPSVCLRYEFCLLSFFKEFGLNLNPRYCSIKKKQSLKGMQF